MSPLVQIALGNARALQDDDPEFTPYWARPLAPIAPQPNPWGALDTGTMHALMTPASMRSRNSLRVKSPMYTLSSAMVKELWVLGAQRGGGGGGGVCVW